MSNDNSSVEWLKERIAEWVKANHEKGDLVEFYGCFYSFNTKEEFSLVQDVAIAFGVKQNLVETMKLQKEEIEKDTNDFINW